MGKDLLSLVISAVSVKPHNEQIRSEPNKDASSDANKGPVKRASRSGNAANRCIKTTLGQIVAIRLLAIRKHTQHANVAKPTHKSADQAHNANVVETCVHRLEQGYNPSDQVHPESVAPCRNSSAHGPQRTDRHLAL